MTRRGDRRRKAWRPAGQDARAPVKAPAVPARYTLPRAGNWVWTCRAGFERYLYEELAEGGGPAVMLGPALVQSAGSPRPPPAFARMGFVVLAAGELGTAALGERLAERLVKALGGRRACVQTWAPDTEAGNRLTATASALGEALVQALPESARWTTAQEAKDRGGELAQVCVLDAATPGGPGSGGGARVVLGLVPANDALSLYPGGRQRMRRGADAPSRAALKLDEALEGLAVAPGPFDVCVDLGAAPGGWTQRLVARGARVIAVDPGSLRPELASHRRVLHLGQSAFDFAPEEPVDWLFCDMAWRPLEVAALLGRWARRGWANQLVANFKLPMQEKNAMVRRVRAVLEEAGWRHLRVRQLYHDRDEVTVTARRF